NPRGSGDFHFRCRRPAVAGLTDAPGALSCCGNCGARMATWIIETINSLGYAGIFLLMLAESLFPPIPSELIIPFAGFSAANGTLNLWLVLLSATVGAVVGMLPWYFAGRLFGLERVRWLADRFGRIMTLNSEEIDTEIGRASCRGRVEVSGGAGTVDQSDRR